MWMDIIIRRKLHRSFAGQPGESISISAVAAFLMISREQADIRFESLTSLWSSISFSERNLIKPILFSFFFLSNYNV